MRKLFLLSTLYGSSTVIVKIIGFTVFMFLAKELSVDNYAAFGLLYALQQGFIAFFTAGIVEAIIGKLKNINSSEEKTILLNQSNPMLAFICLCISLVFLSSFPFLFPNNSIDLIDVLISLFIGCLSSFYIIKSRVSRLENKHIKSILFTFLPSFFSFIIGFLFFQIFKTHRAFFLGFSLGLMTGLLMVLIKEKFKNLSFRFDSETKSLLKNSIPFILVGFLSWLTAYGNNYILDIFSNKHEIAKFTFAISLCSIMLIVANSLNQIWSPKFYTMITHQSVEIVEEINQKFYSALSLFLGIISGGLLLILPFLIDLVGGSLLKYKHISLENLFLFAAYVIQTPRWQCENHLLSSSHGKLMLRLNVLSSCIAILFTIITLYFFGAIGVYLGFFFKMLVHTLLTFYFTRKMIPVKFSYIWSLTGIMFLLLSYVLTINQISLPSSLSIYVIIIGLVTYTWYSLNKNFMRPFLKKHKTTHG